MNWFIFAAYVLGIYLLKPTAPNVLLLGLAAVLTGLTSLVIDRFKRFK